MKHLSCAVCVLLVIACGGGDKAKGDAFVAAYAETVKKVSLLCVKKRELVLQPPSAAKSALEIAIAVSMGRAIAGYTLPEAPSSMASCRADAVAALDALQTALAPLVKKAAEPEAGESVHIRNAVARELWDKAQPAATRALGELARTWDSCKEQAKEAGASDVPLTVPYFAMGC